MSSDDECTLRVADDAAEAFAREQSTWNQLEAIFYGAFTEFLERERSNILKGTSERNLCACLAPVLERRALEAGLSGYRADVEYNRKQEGQVKTIMDDALRVIRITPDLILHSRGEMVEADNLIAVEMKRLEHPEAEKDKDRTRLRALTKSSYDGVWSADGNTHPEHVCGYVLGFYLELDVEARVFRVEEFQRGDRTDERTMSF